MVVVTGALGLTMYDVCLSPVSAICSDGGEEEGGGGHFHGPQEDAETLRQLQVHSG